MAKGRTSARRIINGVEYQFGSEGKIKEMLVEAIQHWPEDSDKTSLPFGEALAKNAPSFIEQFAEIVQPREIECLDSMTKLDAIAFILDR